jgi:hypothetical protein
LFFSVYFISILKGLPFQQYGFQKLNIMTTTKSLHNDVLARHSLSEKDAPGKDAIEEDSNDKSTRETEESTEYIAGFKLYAAVGSVTLACFLLLLDLSILATVSSESLIPHTAWTYHHRLHQ